MNRSLLVTLVLIFAVTGFSCSEEFLHKEPQGITAETVFTNEKGQIPAHPAITDRHATRRAGSEPGVLTMPDAHQYRVKSMLSGLNNKKACISGEDLFILTGRCHEKNKFFPEGLALPSASL